MPKAKRGRSKKESGLTFNQFVEICKRPDYTDRILPRIVSSLTATANLNHAIVMPSRRDMEDLITTPGWKQFDLVEQKEGFRIFELPKGRFFGVAHQLRSGKGKDRKSVV